jgi:hypothetical protein
VTASCLGWYLTANGSPDKHGKITDTETAGFVAFSISGRTLRTAVPQLYEPNPRPHVTCKRCATDSCAQPIAGLGRVATGRGDRRALVRTLDPMLALENALVPVTYVKSRHFHTDEMGYDVAA